MSNWDEYFFFQLPLGYDINKTIDLLFKVHIIFGLKFDANLKNMFEFLQYFVYNIREKDLSPTTRMKDIFKKLTNWIQTGFFHYFL